MKRKCGYCKKEKEEDEFYIRNKRECKACLSKRALAWHKKNPDYRKEWYRKHPGYHNIYQTEHREEQAIRYRKWYETKGRKRRAGYVELITAWRKLNPEKCTVHKLIYLAIKMGKILRPKICERCKKERKIVAHHEDYNFPFKITWLCYS